MLSRCYAGIVDNAHVYIYAYEYIGSDMQEGGETGVTAARQRASDKESIARTLFIPHDVSMIYVRGICLR